MKKSFLLVILMIMMVCILSAQTNPSLAILPFTGGNNNEGDTISILFSGERVLREAFNILQRNSAINRIMEEHLYQQRSGLINNDVMSRINQINQADLVVSGHITRLRDTNLIIISIFDVTEFQQIAGVYQVYNSLIELRNLLPDLAQRLVEASRKEYKNLPGLAIPSFTVPAGVDQSDAMVLSHILAAEIANTGRYAVFPRTESVEDVLREHTFQRSGLTSGSVAMGTTRSIDYVLSPELLSLENTTMFNVQILHTENGNLVEASNKEYEDLTDGINKNLMAELAMELTGRTNDKQTTTINDTTSSLIVGTLVPGETLTEKLTWLQRSADSHNTYIVEVNANENIAPHILEYRGAINITIVIRGVEENRTIRLRSHGTMFTIRPDVTLILDGNITLQGHRGNTGDIVNVNGGRLIINEGSIISGGELRIDNRGSLVMDGGTITGDSIPGSGVWIVDRQNGTFTMNDGIITGNTTSYGGGVHIGSGGTFTMNGGIISGNIASFGGGVYRRDGGHFLLRGGLITDNIASEYGGGVFIQQGWSGGTFTKTGGIITGYNSDQDNGNKIMDEIGILARRGHAVYVDENRRIEITLEHEDRLNSSISGAEGGWFN